MKLFKRFLIVTITLSVVFVIGHLIYLNTMTAKESYPADTYLQTVTNKKAMIIVAHDDDALFSSGTIMKLTDDGWKVKQVCFYNPSERDMERTKVRKNSFKEVSRIQNLEGIEMHDLDLMKDSETVSKISPSAFYGPVPYEKFNAVFNMDSLYKVVAKYIEDYKPNTIFILDDSIGGYGNSNHMVVSKTVMNYCKNNKDNKELSVKKIYQSVFTPSMSESILVKNSWSSDNMFVNAKKMYKINGMPVPTTEIDIYPWAKRKKECLMAYPSERRNIKKITPYFHVYPY